jgi:hypothetical protein
MASATSARSSAAIEIGRRPAVEGRPVLLEEDELKPLRDRPRFARASATSVADGMFEIDEKARLDAAVRLIDKHAALHEERLKAFEHHIDHRLKQRMAGRDEGGLRLAGDQALLEGDAGIAI